jgi:hypothetical protein
MKRIQLALMSSIVMLLVLSCNLPVAAGIEKMKPVHFDTSGDRQAYSGDYSCNGQDKVTIDIDENGIASIITTGPRYVDYLNCVQDPDFSVDSFTLDGIADPDIKEITITSCNSGGFVGDGRISYKDDKPTGDATCLWKDSNAGNKVAMRLFIPSTHE